MNTTRYFAILSFVIPMFLVTNYTLNHFYVVGGFVFDSGWFAYIFTHSTFFPPKNPPILYGSYFDIHISPILYLYTAIYQLLCAMGFHAHAVIFFSVINGMWFGFFSLAGYYLLLFSATPLIKPRFVSAFIFALLLLFNGISLSIISFPHFEILICIFLLWFFVFFVRGKILLSIVMLLFGLLVREDAGLHYFGLFFLLAVYGYFTRKPPVIQINYMFFLKLSLFCLAYALIVIALQRCFCGHNALSRIYLGVPTWHHVTWALLKQRAHIYFFERAYIWLPMIVILCLAYVRHNLFLVLGILSALPWMIFSFFALSDLAGTLAIYYAYPVLIAMLWPAVANAFYALSFKYLAHAVLVISLVFYSGWWNPLYFIWSSFGVSWVKHMYINQTSLDHILWDQVQDGQIVVDTAVASLEIDKLNRKNFNFHVDTVKKMQALIFLPQAVDSENTQALLAKANFTVQCQLNQSDFIVATSSQDPLNLCRNKSNEY